ncbi:MAG: SUMF1/EgtB/PvdO family nonheme iron enzyme [Pseudomonadota bacterium]
MALRERLEAALGSGAVFMDVHGIRAGQNFETRLQEEVARCDAMVVVIGPDWLTEPDPRSGAPKIEDPLDFVHIEIMTALIRRIPVFPVLIDGATMPHETDLPPLIRGLSKQQAQDLPQNNLMEAAFGEIVGAVKEALRRAEETRGDEGALRERLAEERRATAGLEERLLVAEAARDAADARADAASDAADELRAKLSAADDAVVRERAETAKALAGHEQRHAEAEAELSKARTEIETVKAERVEPVSKASEVDSPRANTGGVEPPPGPASPTVSSQNGSEKTKIHRPVEPMRRWLAPAGLAGGALAFAVYLAMSPESGSQRVFSACDGCPKMITLPAGEFVMGSPESEPGRFEDEGPVRTVSIALFAMGETEVTWDQWRMCQADGGCSKSQSIPEDADGSHPVTDVSWYDAVRFTDWLNRVSKDDAVYRLPSEAEWEYAARAGTTSAFHFGDSISVSDANFAAPGGLGRTASVASYPPNAFGLFDMHGNVQEWVGDCRHRNYEDAPVDGAPWLSEANGNCERRIQRSGAFNSISRFLRSAARTAGLVDKGRAIAGFRVAATLK